jgi:hypothetical protein
MNGVCKNGIWGLGWLENHSKPSRDQCAYVLSTSGSTTPFDWSLANNTKVDYTRVNGGGGTTW